MKKRFFVNLLYAREEESNEANAQPRGCLATSE